MCKGVDFIELFNTRLTIFYVINNTVFFFELYFYVIKKVDYTMGFSNKFNRSATARLKSSYHALFEPNPEYAAFVDKYKINVNPENSWYGNLIITCSTLACFVFFFSLLAMPFPGLIIMASSAGILVSAISLPPVYFALKAVLFYTGAFVLDCGATGINGIRSLCNTVMGMFGRGSYSHKGASDSSLNHGLGQLDDPEENELIVQNPLYKDPISSVVQKDQPDDGVSPGSLDNADTDGSPSSLWGGKQGRK